jgi:hypothetical protein
MTVAVVVTTTVRVAVVVITVPGGRAAGEHAQQDGHEAEQTTCTRQGVLDRHDSP